MVFYLPLRAFYYYYCIYENIFNGVLPLLRALYYPSESFIAPMYEVSEWIYIDLEDAHLL